MPQSLAYNYSHITFSTKNRQPLIDKQISDELFTYIGGICKKIDCNPIAVGGYSDHVHILCVLSRKLAIMKIVEEVKSHSSLWIKKKGEKHKNFYWQHGYGSFSVNPMEVEVAKGYILNQEKHHRKKTFKEEYLGFLNKYGIPYDERYLWD